MESEPARRLTEACNGVLVVELYQDILDLGPLLLVIDSQVEAERELHFLVRVEQLTYQHLQKEL